MSHYVIVRVAVPEDLADVLGPFVVHRQWGDGIDWVVTHNPTGCNISKGRTFTRAGAVAYARALLRLRSARWWRELRIDRDYRCRRLEPIATQVQAELGKHANPEAA